MPNRIVLHHFLCPGYGDDCPASGYEVVAVEGRVPVGVGDMLVGLDELRRPGIIIEVRDEELPDIDEAELLMERVRFGLAA